MSKRKNKKKPIKLPVILILFIFIILITAFIYGHVKGYYNINKIINDILTPPSNNSNNNNQAVTVFEQNEQGFYYYNEINNPYYNSIKDLEGSSLKNELTDIVNNNFNPRSYGEARYILSYSDRNPYDDNKSVLGIYDNDKISLTWIGVGEGAWQREHVWPNSKLGVERVANSNRNIASDLHNLRAITGINQTRSNRYFDEDSGSAKTVGTEAFYPGDNHKGDVARIAFYMLIKYDYLTLTDDTSKLSNNSETNYKVEGAYFGKLSLLIKWHKEDPVDEFEINRNNFIYSGIAYDDENKPIEPQGNRNPFIDKPELVHLIWEEKTINDLIKKEEPSIENEVNNSIHIKNKFILFIEIDFYFLKENNL